MPASPVYGITTVNIQVTIVYATINIHQMPRNKEHGRLLKDTTNRENTIQKLEPCVP